RVRTAHGLAYRARPVVQPPAHPDPGAEPAPVRGLTARPVERPPATRAGPPSTAPAAPPRARPARPADLLGRAASAVDEHPLDPEARILASLAHLSHGQAAEAVREARAAVYLDSSLAVGHLIMGRANAALGRPETAARAYRRAQRLPAPA